MAFEFPAGYGTDDSYCPQMKFVESWRIKGSDSDSIARAKALIAPVKLDGKEEHLKCVICAKQIWSKAHDLPRGREVYEGQMGDDEARRCVETLADGIRADQLYLRDEFLPKHCKGLMKQWGKNKTKRDDYLRSLPDLPTHRFPSIVASAINKSQQECFDMRSSFLLPYFNKEMLADDPKMLLKILHQRIYTPTKDWVTYDDEVLQYPWSCSYFKEKIAGGCVSWDDTRNPYGVWEKFSKAKVHVGKAYYTPRAILILEAQRTLFSLLRRLVTIVLTLTSPEAIDRSSIHGHGMMEWLSCIREERTHEIDDMSFAREYMEQPFSSPPSVDFATIVDLCQNQATEIQDELWLLQTDLEYFCDVVDYQSEHHYCNRRNVNAKGWDAAYKAHTIADDIVSRVMDRHIHAKYQTEEAQLVLAMQEQRLKSSDLCQGRTHGITQNHLAGLQRFVYIGMNGYLGDLQLLVEQSQEFASRYVPDLRVPQEPGAWSVLLRDAPQKLFKQDPLVWCLHSLCRRFKSYANEQA